MTQLTNTAELEQYLKRAIPLAERLGAQVAAWDGTTLSLKAPLEPNINHRQTVFGGSIAALAILTGWSLVHLKMTREGLNDGVDLVISKSTVEFDRPIDGEFSATSSAPDEKTWERFCTTLQKRGKARLYIQADLEANGVQTGRFEGTYVAIRRTDG